MGLSENDDTPMSILMVTCSKTIGLGLSLFSEKHAFHLTQRPQFLFSPSAKAKLTFQALRMFLNQEMQQLDALLEAACEKLLGHQVG